MLDKELIFKDKGCNIYLRLKNVIRNQIVVDIL